MEHPPGDFAPFLAASAVIDWRTPAVEEKAKALAGGLEGDPVAIARACFEFVRDEIDHSADHGRDPVTCRASEVLHHGHGFCYAKSHLLAALLRANAIPAGFCYQRLTIEPGDEALCLHGLNAVWLEGYGWYRIDARGNKEGVEARFTPPDERLAFAIEYEGETDLPGIWAEPMSRVVDLLTASRTHREVLANLPDLEPPSGS